MLEVNDWIIINSITYKIHAIEDFDEMRYVIMKQLGDLIDFDSSSFYVVANKKDKELGRPVGIDYAAEDMQDYLKVFKDVDYSKGLMSTGKNITYRESDIMPDKVRVETQYYKKVYDKQNWHFSLHLNICFQEDFLGVMSFFRKKGKKDFEYKDIFILDMIKDHLALRLNQEAVNRSKGQLTLSEMINVYKFTSKEAVILELLTEGYKSEDICSKLFIAQNTLKKHILNIYKKAGVNGRVQLLKKIRMD